MSSFTCDMYYVGHGCMFYVEVIDNQGNIEKKILIDAGTTSDASRYDVFARITASPASLIILYYAPACRSLHL